MCLAVSTKHYCIIHVLLFGTVCIHLDASRDFFLFLVRLFVLTILSINQRIAFAYHPIFNQEYIP